MSLFKGVILITTIFWIYRVVDMVIMILQWAIVIRAFLSWIPHSPSNPLIRIIYDTTEPLLKPFRRIRLGGGAMMVDFSPIFAILALILVRSLVLPPVFNLLARLFI